MLDRIRDKRSVTIALVIGWSSLLLAHYFERTIAGREPLIAMLLAIFVNAVKK